MRQTYTIQYSNILTQAGKTWHDLPDSLQQTIAQFLAAKEAWEVADEATQERLLPVLVQADAVIAASIYRLYLSSANEKLDKIKLLALRAKALRLKNNSDS